MFYYFACMVTQTLKLFNIMDLSYDKAKALILWEQRLKQVEETGNFSTGHGSHTSHFFHKNYSPEEKIRYIKRMIELNS